MGGSANFEVGLDTAADVHAGRRVLMIASQDERYVSASLAHAIRHEFPWLDVRLVASIEDVCRATAQTVPLLLLDLDLFHHYERHAAAVQRAHPHAVVAFLTRGVPKALPRDVLSTARVRGVLSMSLALDVWLAAVRVMMLGGEYFSAAFVLAALEGRAESAAAESESEATVAAGRDGAASGLRSLTTRELQILELVARGQQNKLIASALGLSENTVKIHIHHVIAKLGVHNRTEAAGFYLERRASRRLPPAGPPPAAQSPVP